MTARRRLSLSGITLLLLAAALSAAALLTDPWRNSAPLTIHRHTIVREGGGPAVLQLEGAGFSRNLEALLVPVPAAGRDDSQQLEPRIALFQIDSDGILAVASARDRRMVTLDVRAGHRPQILGSLKLREYPDGPSAAITSLVQIGKRALAGISAMQGLLLIDLTDPAAPRKLDYLRLPGSMTEMLAVNGRVYAATLKGGLWQISLDGDRLRAEQVASPRDPWRLAAAGDRLAVINPHGDLALYRLETSGLPRLVGREQLPQAIRGVTLGEEALHLCLADGTLSEYATGDWPRLVLRGQLKLSGRPLRLVRTALPPRLFCSLVGVGVSVIDISRSGHPAIAGWLTTPAPVTDMVAVDGRLLTTGNNGLMIHSLEELSPGRINVEFPLDSRRGETLRLLTLHGEGFVASSTRVVPLDASAIDQRRPGVSGEGQGLLAVPGDGVVKLYAPAELPGAAPALRASLPITGKGTAALLHGERLYALSATSLHVFARDPAGDYQLLGRADAFDNAQSLALAAPDHLLVGDRSRGLVVVSVRDAANPRLVAEQRLPSFIAKGSAGIQDLLVSGSRLFVARGEFGVQVLDLAGLPGLQVVRQIATAGVARKLALHDGLLLVVDRGHGIQLIDTREENNRVLAAIALPSFVQDIIVSKHNLLMTNAVAAVMRLPLPRRLGPVRVAKDGLGRMELPDDLPAGSYRLVIYDRDRRATTDVILN